MPDDDKSIDALGIKPFGESLRIATQGAVDGAAAFFGRICLPAAEEFGLLLRDKVHAWRTTNVASMAETAERLVGDTDAHAHPRLVSQIVNEASWIDDKYLQDMWAGLLASSCNESGDDDSNLLFLNLLSDMTKLQGRLLNHICENAPKFLTPQGLPFGEELRVDVSTLCTIAECHDLQRVDRELDHLRGLELIFGGFDIDRALQYAMVTPTAIALHMYVRCQGSRQSPADYFQLEVAPKFAPSTPESDDAK